MADITAPLLLNHRTLRVTHLKTRMSGKKPTADSQPLSQYFCKSQRTQTCIFFLSVALKKWTGNGYGLFLAKDVSPILEMHRV